LVNQLDGTGPCGSAVPGALEIFECSLEFGGQVVVHRLLLGDLGVDIAGRGLEIFEHRLLERGDFFDLHIVKIPLGAGVDRDNLIRHGLRHVLRLLEQLNHPGTAIELRLGCLVKGRAEVGERVAIITLDTYRMAAVEQLRTFAELLDVPFSVALSANDVRRAIDNNMQADRIFIDTTGKSPRCKDNLPILESTLRAAQANTLLCMAAGTRGRDSKVVLNAYEPMGIDAVCLTKWDETVAPGESLAAVIEQGLPLSHLCIGQEVPSDIVVADGKQIAQAAFDCEMAEATA